MLTRNCYEMQPVTRSLPFCAKIRTGWGKKPRVQIKLTPVNKFQRAPGAAVPCMKMTYETTVRDIAIAVPASVRVFEKYQIDFCCNGRRTLHAACLEAGISPEDLLAEITAAGARDAAPAEDWSTAPLSALAAHVIERHHAYLERELPQIEARLEKVVANHAAGKP